MMNVESQQGQPELRARLDSPAVQETKPTGAGGLFSLLAGAQFSGAGAWAPGGAAVARTAPARLLAGLTGLGISQPLAGRELPAIRRVPLFDRTREMRWIGDNREEYAGQWVALDGGRLIAAGANAKAVFQAAKAAGLQRPFVVQVEPPDVLPFGGW